MAFYYKNTKKVVHTPFIYKNLKGTTTRSDNPLMKYRLFSYLFSASASFIALTLSGKPNNVMKPSASWWSYKSPVVKLAELEQNK